MKKLLIVLLSLSSLSAFASDGLDHLNLRVKFSGYTEAPQSVWLHTVNAKADQFSCDQKLSNSYNCSTEMDVPLASVSHKLYFSIAGGFATTSIESSIYLVCADNREVAVNTTSLSKQKENGASMNVLSTMIDIAPAYYECNQ